MPKDKDPQVIFDHLKELYSKASNVAFETRVENYFYENFFTAEKEAGTSMVGIVLSEKEREQFQLMLSNAINKLKDEEKQAAMPEASRTKRAIRFVGRLIADLSTLGLWRLLKTPSAQKQFTNLVNYSQSLVDRELGNKIEEAFPRSPASKAEPLFKDYEKVLNQQTLEGTYDTAEAIAARNKKLDEIKAKLSLIDKEKVPNVESAQESFYLSVMQREKDIAKARASFKELSAKVHKITSKVPLESTLDQSIPKFTQALKDLRGKALIDIPTDFTYPITGEQLETRAKALEGMLILKDEAGTVSQTLEELEASAQSMKASVDKRMADINELAQLDAELDKINSPEVVLMSDQELKDKKMEIREASERIKEEQKLSAKQYDQFMEQIENLRSNYEDLKKNIDANHELVTQYKTRVDTLAAQAKADKKEPLASLRDALTQKLKNEIPPVSVRGLGEYTDQRDELVKVIVDNVMMAVEGDPSITADYLSKQVGKVKINELKIIKGVADAVVEDAKQNLQKWKGRSTFEAEAEAAAAAIVEKTSVSIGKELVGEVSTHNTNEEQMLSDFKNGLAENLKKKIQPYKVRLLGEWEAERNEVVNHLVATYTKELQNDFSLASLSSRDAKTLQSIDPPKETIEQFLRNYSLKKDPDGTQARAIAEAAASEMAENAVKTIRPKLSVNKEEHRSKWTDVLQAIRDKGEQRKGR